MRRLSAILVTAVVLAALVPSATLAGKAVPVVTSVTVTELTDLGPDLCAVRVQMTFTGRAQYVRFTAVKDGVGISTPTPALQRSATTREQHFLDVSLGANVWSWKVQLLDRKYQPLGAEVQTSAEGHTGETCPSTGAVLATYP